MVGLSDIQGSLQVAWSKSIASLSSFASNRSTSAINAAAQQSDATAKKQFRERSKVFGRNVLPVEPQKTIFQLMWIAFHDRTLIMLTIVAIISLIIGVLRSDNEKQHEWIEGLAIIIAVAIVLTVQSINDYQKERQFRRLNAKKEDRAVKGIRNGQKALFSVFDIQVGDVLSLEPGDLVSVDGVLISAQNLKCDESSATGESDLIKKQAYTPGDECKDPFILSGSKVSEGIGEFLVIAVGERSLHGKTMMGLRIETEDTPLQVKLDALAENIAKAGITVACLLFISMLTRFCIVSAQHGWPSGGDIANQITNVRNDTF
jgi:Ca2+-transporting ATPase